MRTRVVFADGAVKASYEKLKNGTSEDKRLLGHLEKAFDKLAENAFSGIQIPKKQIPKRYTKEYGIDNLWKYNLPGARRLLYSVARDEVVVISIILEWMGHKEYEKRFGY